MQTLTYVRSYCNSNGQKLILVQIERCQITCCITFCCKWGCIAADQSGLTPNNGYMRKSIPCGLFPGAYRALPQSKNCSTTVWGAQEPIWSVHLAPKFPRSQSNQSINHLQDVLDRQVRPMKAPPGKPTGLKGSGANILVSDTTTHRQGSSGVCASTDQSCFGSKMGTNTILGRWS